MYKETNDRFSLALSAYVSCELGVGAQNCHFDRVSISRYAIARLLIINRAYRSIRRFTRTTSRHFAILYKCPEPCFSPRKRNLFTARREGGATGRKEFRRKIDDSAGCSAIAPRSTRGIPTRRPRHARRMRTVIIRREHREPRARWSGSEGGRGRKSHFVLVAAACRVARRFVPTLPILIVSSASRSCNFFSDFSPLGGE